MEAVNLTDYGANSPLPSPQNAIVIPTRRRRRRNLIYRNEVPIAAWEQRWFAHGLGGFL